VCGGRGVGLMAFFYSSVITMMHGPTHVKNYGKYLVLSILTIYGEHETKWRMIN